MEPTWGHLWPTGLRWAPFLPHEFCCLGNHTSSNVWDIITHPFKNFSAYTIEVWESISNFIIHFIMSTIIIGCRIKVNLSKGGSWPTCNHILSVSIAHCYDFYQFGIMNKVAFHLLYRHLLGVRVVCWYISGVRAPGHIHNGRISDTQIP